MINNVPTYEIEEMLIHIERFKIFTQLPNGHYKMIHFSFS